MTSKPKPWKAIAVKSGQTQKAGDYACDTSNNLITLEYVYGYRCSDTRNNIMYNPDGKLIYHIAQLGIQLDPRENTQRFITQNQDEILCLDTWQNESITCDVGEQPMLSLWNNVTMKPIINIVSSNLKKGIGIVRFSNDGNYIACSMLDEDNSINHLIKGEKESKIVVIYRS